MTADEARAYLVGKELTESVIADFDDDIATYLADLIAQAAQTPAKEEQEVSQYFEKFAEDFRRVNVSKQQLVAGWRAAKKLHGAGYKPSDHLSRR